MKYISLFIFIFFCCTLYLSYNSTLSIHENITEENFEYDPLYKKEKFKTDLSQLKNKKKIDKDKASIYHTNFTQNPIEIPTLTIEEEEFMQREREREEERINSFDELYVRAKEDLRDLKNLDLHNLHCDSRYKCVAQIRKIFTNIGLYINHPDVYYNEAFQVLKDQQKRLMETKINEISKIFEKN